MWKMFTWFTHACIVKLFSKFKLPCMKENGDCLIYLKNNVQSLLCCWAKVKKKKELMHVDMLPTDLRLKLTIPVINWKIAYIRTYPSKVLWWKLISSLSFQVFICRNHWREIYIERGRSRRGIRSEASKKGRGENSLYVSFANSLTRMC